MFLHSELARKNKAKKRAPNKGTNLSQVTFAWNAESNTLIKLSLIPDLVRSKDFLEMIKNLTVRLVPLKEKLFSYTVRSVMESLDMSNTDLILALVQT